MSLRLLLITPLAVALSALPAYAGVHAAVTAYPVGDGESWPVELAGGDFDGDGITDLGVAGIWTGGGDFSVLTGNRDGTLKPALVYGDRRFGSIAVADFDEDGLSDAALATDSGAAGVFVEFSNGDGTFDEATLPTATSASVATGDFNGDHHADVVAATTSGIALLLGDGDGGFAGPAIYLPGSSGYGKVAAGDVNADGRDDVITGTGQGIAVLLGKADGTLQDPKTTSLPACCITGLAVGRFDADARTDVAVSYAFTSDVSILTASADGTLVSHGTIPFHTGGLVGAGDANKDDKRDLILASGGGSLALALGNGDGSFQSLLTLPGGAQFARPTAVDLNDDGFADLAVGDYRTHTVIVGVNTPTIVPSVAALNFGILPAGQASAPTTVTLRNDGLPPLAIHSLTFRGANPGDFRLVTDACAGHTLGGDQTCTLSLAATPAAGARAAELVIDSNAGDGAKSIALTASGLVAPLTTKPVIRDTVAPTLTATAPVQTLARVLRRGLKVTVGCSEACTLKLQLFARAKDTRRLKLPATRPLAHASPRLTAAGKRQVTLKLSVRARRALSPLRRIDLTLATLAADAAGNERTRTLVIHLR
jgi:hypothetical protein